ncbi:cupin domain-containing protein [Aestuariivirga sp.]|uniref:cupin domain-containing protein n=1 Tax=Aestuariivirga sp. TaxID=2650926 RepID=UPI003593DD72
MTTKTVTTKPVIFSKANVELNPSPIRADWIIEGRPVARNAILSRSEDQTACTIVWDCSEGKFNWHYDFDETVYFIEGSVTIEDGHGPARTLGPGDVIFFPAGSHAVWTVHEYIRKVAFCRKILPAPVGALIKTARAIKHKISPPKGEGSLMGAN